jgi:Ca2+-binding EF-hand superfamily protein
LREILRELDDQLTEQELDIMIEEIDSDGSGTVDFDGKCSDSSLIPDVISIKRTS